MLSSKKEINMSRPVTIFSGQWADLPLETLCQKVADFGYNGIELACWVDHFDVERAAARFGVPVVNGFTGSPIWAYLYSFPMTPPDMVEKGYQFFAEMWNPILDVFRDEGVKFALEVHPTEIAFDIVTAEKTLKALGGRRDFGFNYDPSHLGYQGVDYIGF